MRIDTSGLLLAAVMLAPARSATGSCTLHNLAIHPIKPGRSDVFTGVGRAVRVEFKNESGRDDVRVFPEPPMTIRHLDSNKSCTIEGGNWARDSVFLSEDEGLLVVLEFSGESNHLIAYATGSCEELRDLDVSGGRWRVTRDGIVIGTHCASRAIESCKARRTVLFKDLCASSGFTHER